MRADSAQNGLVEEEQSPDSIGQMANGEGGATDVTDIGADLKRAPDRLAGELVAPLQLAHLIAVGFLVLDDLDLLHTAVSVDAQRVSDQLVLADYLVDEEPANHFALGQRLPRLLLGHAPGHARVDHLRSEEHTSELQSPDH